jgi:membrane protease YdiL (CAAX protease family)
MGNGSVDASQKYDQRGKIGPTELVRSSAVVYGAMGLVGFEIMWWYHKNVAVAFAVNDVDWFLTGRVAATSIAFLLLLHLVFEEYFPSYRSMKRVFGRLFAGLHWWQVLLLAVLSSVAEEILFRGAIQPFLGVGVTAVLFGLMHLDPMKKSMIWTVWAFTGGVILGMADRVTGHLWAPVLIHFGVNSISLGRAARQHQIAQSKKSKVNKVLTEIEDATATEKQ